MSTIREKASQYEQKETLNIADLNEVSTEIDIVEKTFTRQDGEEFSINIIEVDGKQYRVPNSVLKDLKTLVKEKPGMTKFKVLKSGTGMSTDYQVVVLE